jgi:hypothetical protein
MGPKRFGLDQKQLFITKVHVLNPVQNILVILNRYKTIGTGPKQFGRVKNSLRLIEGKGTKYKSSNLNPSLGTSK